MNPYLKDLMAFADLLAACNVIHEEAVYDSDDYDGGITMRQVAEAHRRLRESSPAPIQRKCGWRGMAGGEGCLLYDGHDGPHQFRDGSRSRQNVEESDREKGKANENH